MRSLRRVLIVHPYGIGDLLFITPVLRALRLLPSVETVDLILGSRTESMIQTNPHVDGIITVDRDYLKSLSFKDHFKEILRIGKRIKSARYDLLLDFSLRREYAAAALVFGIPVRAGFDYKGRGCFLTHKLSIPDGFADRHVVHYYADCAEKAGVNVLHRVMELYLDPGEESLAQQRLEKLGFGGAGGFVAVAPGGGESWGADAVLKRWPLENYQLTLQRMRRELGVRQFLVLGSAAEKEMADELAQSVEGAVSLAGQCSLMEASALIKHAKLFLGNDGGLVHIAHALRTPLVAIYGPVDPKVYGPWPETERAVTVFKGPSDYKRFRYNKNGKHIKEIGLDKVWDALLKAASWRQALTSQ